MFLILAVIFALGIAYFATQNTAGVTIRLAQTVFPGIPLYMVMIVSMLVGMLMAWVVSLIDNVGSLFVLRGKDARIRHAQNTVHQLETRLQDLEVENAKLRGEQVTDQTIHTRDEHVESEAQPIHRRSPLFANFRSMFR